MKIILTRFDAKTRLFDTGDILTFIDTLNILYFGLASVSTCPEF